MNKEYREALQHVLRNGTLVQPRGLECVEVLGYVLKLRNPKQRIVTYNSVKTSIAYATEELKWYLRGTNKIADLDQRFQRVWKDFSDDGEHVNSAYGHRIFGAHPLIEINQWDWVKKKLLDDRDSRQAIININSPFDKLRPTKDFPCCVAMHFFIRDEKLYLNTMWRSHDIFKGMRNDVFTMTALQEKMANEMSLKLGEFQSYSSSLHLYRQDYEKVNELMSEKELLNVEYDVSEVIK